MARRLLLAAAALPAAFAIAAAQNIAANAPATSRIDYALTNARIVVAPGKVIEHGTVIIRDGRIAAVGANVTVPAGAVKMDLAGQSVYAGLIDAATSIALPSPTRALAAAPDAAAAPAGGRGGRGGAQGIPAAGRGGPPPPPVVIPEIDAWAEAADQFSPTDAQLQAFRAGGVTTVGLVYNGGIFPGRVGAALTAPRSAGELTLKADAGQEVSFGVMRGRAYPESGIGSVAYIRQAYLDAQYEARVDNAFKKGIPGGRPAADAFRRALMPAATNEMLSWFVASKERDIIRVGEIAKEMGLKNPVVVGSQEGWQVIPNLKSMGATAVVSLQWPEVDDVSGRAFLAVGMGKSGVAPTPTHADTMEIRGNAAALTKAGIPVAFASFGGDGGASFRDRVRASIEAGMSPDDALRAVTVTPASVLGVSAAVGTVEVGKLANLVVVSGNDLFAAGNPIKHVFIEGRIY
ncbi:MAG TPA: amidohydrolase family protein [Gemmatimonadaceae bacterium]|jgi:imidazolonepropionase-like amidohydrolase|nr:amidohydrolase family protein [Gemmatimonadaceae bacterium]